MATFCRLSSQKAPWKKSLQVGKPSVAVEAQQSGDLRPLPLPGLRFIAWWADVAQLWRLSGPTRFVQSSFLFGGPANSWGWMGLAASAVVPGEQPVASVQLSGADPVVSMAMDRLSNCLAVRTESTVKVWVARQLRPFKDLREGFV